MYEIKLSLFANLLDLFNFIHKFRREKKNLVLSSENLCARMDKAMWNEVNQSSKSIYLYSHVLQSKRDDCAKWTDEASGMY